MLQPNRDPVPDSVFPIEVIAKYPLPGTAVPGEIAFSPDDRLITFLLSPDRSLNRLLYAFNPELGEQVLLAEPPGEGVTDENISLQEALERERIRQREIGVTHYAWAEHANRMLLPIRGEIYVKDGIQGPLRKIVSAGDFPPLDPQISPDGQWLAYVKDAELYILPALGGEPRQLTQGARGSSRSHGLAEYIAQEEMGRSHGFWWSPDSRRLAFEAVDETNIPVYRIVHQGKNFTGENAQEDHRYPFAGQPNARVRLGVVSIDGGDPAWMDLGDNEDIYLARVHWLPDGSLSAQVENRQQTRLDLIHFDPGRGQAVLWLQETNPHWINLHDLFKPLQKGGFIWASERSGYRHLYLYDQDGKLIRQLTEGQWMVDALCAVDEDKQVVYFTANRETPLESHLYAVPYSAGAPRRLTHVAGMHEIICDHNCTHFVDIHQSLNQPPAISLRSLEDGTLVAKIFEEPLELAQRP